MIRRSRAEWRDLFSQQEASGLTAAEFCRQQSLCSKYFCLRKRQLRWSGSSVFAQVEPVIELVIEPVIEPGAESSDVVLRVVELTIPISVLSSTLSQLLR